MRLPGHLPPTFRRAGAHRKPRGQSVRGAVGGMHSGRADLAGEALGEAAEWERPEAPSVALRIGRTLVAMTAAQSSGTRGTRDTLRAVVQDAGNAILGWFHIALEASMMGWSDKRLQPFQPELEAAQHSEPDRATIRALAGLLGQKEIRDSRRAIAPAIRMASRPPGSGRSQLAGNRPTG